MPAGQESGSHGRPSEFQRTLETKLAESLSGRRLYFAERKLHDRVSTDQVAISGRISGTCIKVWIYEDEAEFGGGGIDCRFERPDYDTLEELTAAFLDRLAEFLPEAEDIGPIKLPVLINESSEIDAPGDMSLYERLSDAEDYIEAIDVINEEFFGFDAEGRKLQFDVVAGSIRISAAEAEPGHKDIFRNLLASALTSWDAADEAWCRTASLSELVMRGADASPASITMSRQKKARKREPPILDRLFGLFRIKRSEDI